MKIFLLMLSLFINACYFSNDKFEIEGLDKSSSNANGNSSNNNSPSDTSQIVESVILSFTIDDDKIIAEGENLDIIDDFSISGVEDDSENIEQLLQFYNLEIIEQSKTKIVAASSNEDIALYFDENYALLYKEKQEIIPKDFPFIISRIEDEEDSLDEEKMQENLTFDGSKLSTDGIEDKQILTFKGNKWVGEDISGQLEYLGTWDSIANDPTISNQSFKNQTQAGQYLIISNDCHVDCSTDIDGLTTFNKGDWMIFNGENWQQINNRGKVFSFNSRKGVIKACPNELCPNTYDYTWGMINKEESKLEDLKDIQLPTIDDHLKLLKWSANLNRWTLEDDNSGVEKVNSDELVNKTLMDSDFATGISISKFKGLKNELDLLVNNIPLDNKVNMQGHLLFSGSANLTNVSEIETPSGSFKIEELSPLLDTFDINAKQDSLGEVNSNDVWYLSTSADKVLSWKKLDTDHVKEFGSNLYITQDRVLSTVLNNIIPNEEHDIESTDTIQSAFEKLVSRLNSEINSTNTISSIQDNSLTLDKLAVPFGGTESGYLHFNSETNSWGLLKVSGLNFLGEWDPLLNTPELVEGQLFLSGSPDMFFSAGDFYLISKETSSGTSLAGTNKWSEGDWVVWSGDAWNKIDYAGKINNFFGRTGNIQPLNSDYSWSMIDKTNDASSLSDIADVENGSPGAGEVLKWNGSIWSFASDNSSGEDGGIDGAVINNLGNIHFSSDHPIGQSKILGLTESLDSLINKDTPQIMEGDISFDPGGVITGVNLLTSVGNNPISMSLLSIDQSFKNATFKLGDKQSLISDPIELPYDSYFLAGDLEMKKLDTKYVSEGSYNLYITDARVQQTSIGTVEENLTELSSDVLLGDSINILQTKVNNRLDGLSVGNEHFQDNIINKDHFSVTGLSTVDNQFFYYNGSDWEIIEHSGSINYKGVFNPNDTVPDFSLFMIGDYLIASQDGSNGIYKNGDWIIKSSASENWQQVNAVSKVSGFNFGDNQGGLITAKQNDYTLEQINRTNSTLSSLDDISNQDSLSIGLILKLKDGVWSPEIDDRGISKITGSDIAPGSLKRIHLNTDEKILMDAINGLPVDDYLKIESTDQQMTGDMDFAGHILENVGVINEVDISGNYLLFENFDNVKNNLEPLLTFNNEPLNFLNQAKNFTVINHDNIKETNDYKFYNNNSVFGTTLTEYEIAPVNDGHIIDPTDTVQSSLGKLERNLSSQTAESSINVFEYQNYYITAENNLDILVSSYSVYHLPTPNTINAGFTVTIKAQHGPIYIHPNYDTTPGVEYIDRPSIDGADYLILTTPGSLSRLVFDGENWNIVDSFGEYSFSVSKDDAPNEDDCPYGFIPVPGNYLLETDGFCVQQVASQLSEDNMGQDETKLMGGIGLGDLEDGSGQYLKTIPSVGNLVQVIRSKLYENNDAIAKGQNICGNFKASENMAGKIGILTKNQLLTIFHKSLAYTGSNPLNSDSITTFFDSFPLYVKIHPTIHVLTNDGLTVADGKKFYLSTYKYDYRVCSLQSGNTCYSTRDDFHKGSSNELIDWNSLDDNFSYVNNSSCDQATNLIPPFSENFSPFFEGGSEVASSFDSNSFFYVAQKDNECDSTYFDYFTGIPSTENDYKVNLIHSDTPGTDRYTFNNAITEDIGNSILLLSQDLGLDSHNKLVFHPNSKRIDGDDVNANPKYMVFSRCFYIPDEFTCTLPNDIEPRHNVTNCNTTDGFITEESCQVTCSNGYESFPDDPPKATCSSNEGTFTLSGCYNPNISQTKDLQAKSIIFDSESGSVGYWKADTQKINKDIVSNVGSWTSYPNRFGEEIILNNSLNENGLQYINSNSDMNNNPTVSFSGVGIGLTNDDFSRLSSSTAFTRILVTKNNSPSENSISYYDGATGMDGYIYYGDYRSYINTDSLQNAAVDNFSSDPNANKTIVSISTFDSSKSTNVDKLKLRINATDYAFTQFVNELTSNGAGSSNTLTSPGSGIGIGLGSNNTGGNPYNGNIAEVILFDRALSSDEIGKLESHLLVKYGVINTCSLPNDTAGYNLTNCDDSIENISELECSISCSEGYISSALNPASASCTTAQGEFELSGCVLPENLPHTIFYEPFDTNGSISSASYTDNWTSYNNGAGSFGVVDNKLQVTSVFNDQY